MRKVLAAAVFTLAMSSQLAAQQPSQQTQQQPQQQPVVIVSMQKCAFASLRDVNAWMRDTAAPILNDLVRQGRLINWGLLQHMWGDEWNSVIYYTASDLNTANAAISEYGRRAGQADPTMMQKFSSWCSEHKDNIYTLIASDTPPQ